MGMTVTPKAATQIRKALAKRGGGAGLRVTVKTSGCSGYAYALEFADAACPKTCALTAKACNCWWTRAACRCWTAPSSTGCARA